MQTDFGRLLKENREASRLTQQQVVERLQKQGYEGHYSESDVSKWENGRTKPTSDVVEALEDVFGTKGGLLLKAAGYYAEAEVRAESTDDSVNDNIRQARQQHWDKLAEMAEQATTTFHGTYFIGDLEDDLRRGAKPDPKVARFLSSTILEILLPFESGKFYYNISWLRWNNLIEHLDFEFKGLKKMLEDWKEYSLLYKRAKIEVDESKLPELEHTLFKLTHRIIDIFNQVAERKTFKGTCSTCKDW